MHSGNQRVAGKALVHHHAADVAQQVRGSVDAADGGDDDVGVRPLAKAGAVVAHADVRGQHGAQLGGVLLGQLGRWHQHHGARMVFGPGVEQEAHQLGNDHAFAAAGGQHAQRRFGDAGVGLPPLVQAVN